MVAELVGEGRTVFLSSHLLDEVEKTCDAVAMIDQGRLIAQGPIAELLSGARAELVIDCDDPATRSAVRADPGRFVESAEPVLIDEYQHVPELLDAIKAQLNRDLRPGRYVLAGSTRYAAIPAAARASPPGSLLHQARWRENTRPWCSRAGA